MNWYSCTTITQFNFRTFPSSRKSPFVSICRQASLQTSALGSHWPIFFLIDLHFLEIAHNWNYTICRVYVWLLSLRMMTWGLPAWQCLPGVCSFLLSSSVPLCGWATFCLSIHQSVDTWLFSLRSDKVPKNCPGPSYLLYVTMAISRTDSNWLILLESDVHPQANKLWSNMYLQENTHVRLSMEGCWQA